MDPLPRSPGIDLLWLVPLSVVVAAGSWFTNLPAEHGPPAGYRPWLAAALGVSALLGLFGALRWPLRGAVATFAVVTVFIAVDLEDGPVYLTLAAAAFLVASRTPAPRWVRPVTAGTAAVCAALVLRTVADYDNERSLWQLVAVLAVVAAGAAIGTLTRNRALATVERARSAATREQLRMAQDLHDGVGHGLAVIAMQAGVGLHVLDTDPDAARSALEAIRLSARESLDALRAEVSQLAGAPAPRRPRHGVADLDDVLTRIREAGTPVTLTGSAGELPEEIDSLVHSIVQESLTNVLRHSSATAAAVRLERSRDRLVVTVVDDGQNHWQNHGQNHGQNDRQYDEGMGLRGMRTRVEAVGGTFSAGRQGSRGFVVRAEVPL